MSTPYACPNCGTTDVKKFRKNRSRETGLQTHCSPCYEILYRVNSKVALDLQRAKEAETEAREAREVLALIAERNALKAFLSRVASASLDDLCALERELPSGSEDAARSALDSRLLSLDSLDCAAQ